MASCIKKFDYKKNLSVDVSVSIPAAVRVYEADKMVQMCIRLLSPMDATERSFNLTLATSGGTGIL